MPARTHATEAPKKAPKPSPRKRRPPAVAAAETPAGRPILYPEVEVRLCYGPDALTAEQLKEVLGWEEQPDGEDWGSDFALLDAYGKKVRLHNNANVDYTNRPLVPYLYATYRQEHLRKRWRPNGESLIIGETGLLLDGQHQSVGLILGAQEWEKDPGKYPDWETAPTMERVIVFGIKETDDVVNTINTGKPRSLSDVIYRSSYFADTPKKDRTALSRITEFALKMLRGRTAANSSPYAPGKWTHAESVDYLSRHPSLLKAVRHVFAEIGGEAKLKWTGVSPGYASGLLYLMGTSASDARPYRESPEPSEADLDLSNWDKAEEFWTLIAAKSPDLGNVRKAIGRLYRTPDGDEAAEPAMDEKIAVIVKAWAVFADGGKPTERQLALSYAETEYGRTLAESPVTGGIDIGSGGQAPDPAAPTEKELEERKLEVRQAGRRKRPEVARPDGRGPIGLGDTVWVNDAKEPWSGVVLALTEDGVTLRVSPGFAGAGTQRIAQPSALSHEQPHSEAE